MGMQGTKQNNPRTNQYSIDPSHGGGVGGGGGCWEGGGGWGWKVQNRTTHVQTNITLIHLLAGVGGWMGMEGTKQNNSCTNQHSVDPSPGGGGGDGRYKSEQPMYKPTLH